MYNISDEWASDWDQIQNSHMNQIKLMLLTVFTAGENRIYRVYRIEEKCFSFFLFSLE